MSSAISPHWSRHLQICPWHPWKPGQGLLDRFVFPHRETALLQGRGGNNTVADIRRDVDHGHGRVIL